MLPERFGRYQVLAEIGHGAMGRVYAAWDARGARMVAVKILKRELLTGDGAAHSLRRFRREALAIDSLSHPNVARVFEVGEDFVVMEHVAGETLRALVRRRGRIPPAEALRLLAPVADAVDHAHRAGVVHRGIKPANVIVQPDGQPKLMDFGVAQLAASLTTTVGQVLGSPAYMAPEQIAGLELDGRADVYALAVVAYELLTGQAPFAGHTATQVIQRVMHEPPPRPCALVASLSLRYDEVFARALAKERSARHASAGELAAAVRSAGAAELPTLAAPATASATAARHSRWRAARLSVRAAAAAAALTMGALGWAALGRAPRSAPVPLAPSPPPSLAARPDPTPTRTPVAAPRRAPTSVSIATTPVGPSRSLDPAAPVAAPTPHTVVEGEPVELGDGVTPPVRVHGAPAPYPARARALGLEGSVTVRMIVDENGVPSELELVESAGSVLDDAVLDAVRAWRFEPARKDGVRVKVRWTTRQTYRKRP